MTHFSNIWILCDKGKTGTLRQCESVAYSLQKYFNSNVYTIDVKLPFYLKYLPAIITRLLPLSCFSLPKHFDQTSHPLIIAAGRQAVLLAATLAKKNPTIVLQNPRCSLDYFTVVIPPYHDQIKNPKHHVIQTLGALHPHQFNQEIASKEKKVLTIVLGGNSKHYIYTKEDFEKIGEYIKYRNNDDMKFLLIASRRTPLIGLEILKKYLSQTHYDMWPDPAVEGANLTPNPYKEYLEKSNEILVTADSVSMISEACYFNKPVRIWALKIKNKRFQHFYNSLIQNKHATFDLFSDPSVLEHKPLRELDRIIPIILQILHQ